MSRTEPDVDAGVGGGAMGWICGLMPIGFNPFGLE